MAHDPRHLPESLVAPADDGACDDLLGSVVPDVRLRSTTGDIVNVADVSETRTVLYVYPRTGVPGVEMPDGWDTIPGARGCTPQSCAYRDEHSAFRELGVAVYGVSTQTIEAQRVFAAREHIPFPLLSDPDRQLGTDLGLPTFRAGGEVLYRRVTLVVEHRRIVYVRYPVFPPNTDAAQTLAWLRSERG